MYLECDTRIQVGRLGVQDLPAGWYLYVGSALGGLAGRVGRHLRRRAPAHTDRRPHWHIDALLAHAAVQEVWCHQGVERLECGWAAALGRRAAGRPLIAGFGASDCGCATHLFYASGRPDVDRLRALATGPIECVKLAGE